MFVQRVVSPVDGVASWTLGDDGALVAPIEQYLAYLTQIERSPNTVKAYAHDLKDWFVFLGARGLDWREVRLRTSSSSSPGCAARRGCATGQSRFCRRWSTTAPRRRSVGSSPRSARSTRRPRATASISGSC